jgi:hypothetical protein
VNGDFIISASGAVQIASGQSPHILVHGSFLNQGQFQAGSGMVELAGNALQDSISGSNTFYNLKINKPTGEVKLKHPISVTNELDMTSGKIRLEQLSIDLGTTGYIINEDNQNRIYCDCPTGFIRAVRPLGASGTFNPGNLGLEITTTGTAMGTTEVKRRHKLVNLSAGYPASVYRYFEVTPQFNQNLNVTVKFRYFDGEVSALASNPIMDIYRSTDQGGSWTAQGGIHDIANRTIIKTELPGFSWLAAGSGVNALPVTLTLFDAVCAQEGVELTWSTESEINNMHFRVERSENLLQWTEVAVVPGAGNSNAPLHYSITDDRPLDGLAYYRLTQQDFDGAAEVFDPISIVCYSDGEGNSMLVYPNPTSDYFTVSVHSAEDLDSATLQIMDMNGKMIRTRTVSLESGSNEFVFDRTDLNPGSYLIRVYSHRLNLNPVKLIVQ